MDLLGELEEALTFSEQAIHARPDHGLVANNHCYLLVRLQRATEALPYCERALLLMPSSSAVRHSMATVLGALGRCAEAAEQDAESRRLDAVSRRPEVMCVER